MNNSSGETHNNNFENENQTLHQNSFPFRICYVQLTVVVSRCLRVLSSLRYPNYVCVMGQQDVFEQEHTCAMQEIVQLMQLVHVFDLLHYVHVFVDSHVIITNCVFLWKEKRDTLRKNGDNDAKNWAHCADQAISNTTENTAQFGVERNELKLVCSFDDAHISKQ